MTMIIFLRKSAARSCCTAGRKRSCVFTLSEVVVAAMVVALATLGIFGSILAAFHLLDNARQFQEGEKLAVDALWAAFNEPYDDLVQREDNPSVRAVPDESPLYPLGGTIRTAIIRYSDHCRILVRVDWTTRTLSNQAKPVNVSLWVDRYNTEL